jgi:hypothetical protein
VVTKHWIEITGQAIAVQPDQQLWWGGQDSYRHEYIVRNSLFIYYAGEDRVVPWMAKAINPIW